MSGLIGQYVGRYHILEKLGEGGMATVYKAFDTNLDREVAIKVILPSKQQTPKFLKRFEREARALAQLSHPNIIKILDYGEQDGVPFLVLEYTPTGTLKERLGEAIPWQEAARLLEPIAHALEYAHKQKIIHRDIKPSNILITDSGQPVLSDFGIAKLLEPEETWDLTGTGVGIGTPEYMSPEQGLGKIVDHRSDIYSLGVVFYELVTGRKLYQADTPMAVIIKHIHDPLPRPKDFVRDLPKSVEQMIFKALAKKPEDRFEEMGLFADVLKGLSKGVKATIGKVVVPSRMKPPSSVLVGAIAGLAVLVVSTLIVRNPIVSGWLSGLFPFTTSSVAPIPVVVKESPQPIQPTGIPEPLATPTDELTKDLLEGCTEVLTGYTIPYFVQAGLSGPLASVIGTSFLDATNDAIYELNESGGVCGAMVELHLTNTEYNNEQEIASFNETKEEYPNLMSIATFAGGSTLALKDIVNEDHVVNLAMGLNAEALYDPPDGWTVGTAPIYPDQFAGFLKFLIENWDEIKPEGAGDEIVVGVIGWEGAFGAGATTSEVYAYANLIGVTVLPLETLEISGDADVVTPLQSLALQGANVIYLQLVDFGTAQVIGTLHALEMWDSMIIGCMNWALDTDVLTILGEDASAAVGMYGVFPYLWWNDTDEPGVQRALAAFIAGGYPETDKGTSYLHTYASIFGWSEIVKHAINMVGFKNLNGDAFFDAFKDLGTVDNLGIWSYDVRNGSRAPHAAQIRQIQLVDEELQFVVVKDFFELPDLRP